MRARINILWDYLRTSFWFLPSLLSILACVLALFMTWLDRRPTTVYKAAWLFQGGPEGARAVLTAVASSMITVAGVVFSITIVALTLASQQFGPRLLRNFRADRSNQLVLGTFVATFLYSLLVIRSVRGSTEALEEFVPVLSVTTSVLLAVVNFAVLIYFIHHVASSIQVSTIAARVTAELYETIQRMASQDPNESPKRTTPEENTENCLESHACRILIEKNGYLQSLDYETITQIAQKHDVILHVDARPGDFLVKGLSVARVCKGKALNEQSLKQIQKAFIVGSDRTSIQDPEFAIDQLVEIAVRALSTGINDPNTAITCIDRLSEILSYLVNKEIDQPYRYDDEGNLRLTIHHFTFESALEAAFHQIRQYGKTSVAVSIRLLEAIQTIAKFASAQENLDALLLHARLIREDSLSTTDSQQDRSDIDTAFENCLQNITTKGRDG